jgi:hypothetical protein
MWLHIMCERRAVGNPFMGERKWIRGKKSHLCCMLQFLTDISSLSISLILGLFCVILCCCFGSASLAMFQGNLGFLGVD